MCEYVCVSVYVSMLLLFLCVCVFVCVCVYVCVCVCVRMPHAWPPSEVCFLHKKNKLSFF